MYIKVLKYLIITCFPFVNSVYSNPALYNDNGQPMPGIPSYPMSPQLPFSSHSAPDNDNYGLPPYNPALYNYGQSMPYGIPSYPMSPQLPFSSHSTPDNDNYGLPPYNPALYNYGQSMPYGIPSYPMSPQLPFSSHPAPYNGQLMPYGIPYSNPALYNDNGQPMSSLTSVHDHIRQYLKTNKDQELKEFLSNPNVPKIDASFLHELNLSDLKRVFNALDEDDKNELLNNEPLLLLAVESYDLPRFKFWIEQGCNVFTADQDNNNILHKLSVAKNPQKTNTLRPISLSSPKAQKSFILQKDWITEEILKILDAGIVRDLANSPNNNGDIPLFLAIKSKNFPVAYSFAFVTDLDNIDADGNNILHIIVLSSESDQLLKNILTILSDEMVRQLLLTPNNDNVCPLQETISNPNKIQCFLRFLDDEALKQDIGDGNTFFHRLVLNLESLKKVLPLITKSWATYLPELLKIENDEGDTPLDLILTEKWAFLNQNKQILINLFSLGAMPRSFMTLIKAGQADLAATIFMQCSDEIKTALLTSVDENGQTLMHFSATYGAAKLLKNLFTVAPLMEDNQEGLLAIQLYIKWLCDQASTIQLSLKQKNEAKMLLTSFFNSVTERFEDKAKDKIEEIKKRKDISGNTMAESLAQIKGAKDLVDLVLSQNLTDEEKRKLITIPENSGDKAMLNYFRNKFKGL